MARVKLAPGSNGPARALSRMQIEHRAVSVLIALLLNACSAGGDATGRRGSGNNPGSAGASSSAGGGSGISVGGGGPGGIVTDVCPSGKTTLRGTVYDPA